MNYYEVLDHNDNLLVKRTYTDFQAAKNAAARLAGKYKKDIQKRGTAIKVVMWNDEQVWGETKTLKWFEI